MRTSSNSKQPPRWILSFFHWYCHPFYVEDLEGDLIERYERNMHEKGKKNANWRFFRDVLQLFRPGIIKPIEGSYQLNFYGMFKNFLKSGWRSFIKYKTNSLINVFGLSIGICAVIMLYLIIDYENSFDKFHNDYEEIYRLGTKTKDGNYSDMIVTPLTPTLMEEYPDVVSGTRFKSWSDMFLYGEGRASDVVFHLVDSGFFSVFTFEPVHGDLNTALDGPNKLVLTESLAEKMFGYDNPVGKTLTMKEMGYEVTVTAVVNDPPKNSSIQFESLLSWPASPSPMDEDQMGNWYNTFMTGYIRIAKGTDIKEFEDKTKAVTKKHFLAERQSEFVTYFPIEEEHARNTENDRTLNILSIITIAILIISCVNLVNLSVSQWLTRTREVGVRKVLGSLKSQLIFQFLVEGLISTVVSVVVALIGVYIFAPYVNEFYDLDIQYNIIQNAPAVLFIISICILIGIISSFVTSLLLTNVHVIKSLKENIRWSGTGQWLQKSLLVFQFTISLIFIAGTLVITKQISFMKSYDLKFNMDHIVAMNVYSNLFENPEKASQRVLMLREELQKEEAIESVSLSQNMPGKYWDSYNWYANSDSMGPKGIQLKQITVDQNYFSLLDIAITHGRNFSDSINSDELAIIINESAFEKLGWKDLNDKYLSEGGGNQKYSVVGVVEDYHYRSLKESIEPLIHYYSPKSTDKLLVKLKAGRIGDGLQILEDSWASLGAYEPFEYVFVDEEFNELYRTQDRLEMTATVFSGIAVILALLGLFSITSFMLQKRKKEVGVRKVLGATFMQIIVLLSKRFALLVMLAFALATPVIYLMSNEFLSEFTYKMELTPVIFLLSGMIVLLLSMLIVGWQSIHAAHNNPVDSLKSE